jgi:hypothetical protein
MIPIIIYAAGSVANYFLHRRFFIKRMQQWTTGDRVFVLFVSLFSWVGVLSTLLQEAIYATSDWDTPAKW